MLVRAGFVVVLVPVNVSGFRPVLARGWHERARWLQATGTVLLVVERCGVVRVRMTA